MQTTLISITLSFVAGIILGRGFLLFPVTIGTLTALSVPACLLGASLAHRSLLRTASLILPCLAGAAAYVLSAAFVPADDYRRLEVFDQAPREVAGTIVSPLDRDPGRTAFLVALTSLDGRPASGRMRVSVRDDGASAGYGDQVRFSGRVYQPRRFRNPGGFDYAKHLARQGVFATVSLRSFREITVLHRSRGVFRTIQDWRERIRLQLRAATTGPGSAILQAMVLGEEGDLSHDVRDRFMAAGVTHILSISGSHLGLVAVVCFALLRWALFLLPERRYLQLTLRVDPVKIAAACTIPPVVFYALLAGGQVATLRSLVMILAALTALLLDRASSLMHALAAAGLAILIVSPQALFDISFQLSFLSVLSIGYVVTAWNEFVPPAEGLLRRFLRSALLLIIISLTASLATGPLVALYFNQVSLAGVLSNMVIVPFAGFIVVPAGLAAGVLSLAMDRLPLAPLLQSCADAFSLLVTVFSRIPFAEVHPPSPGPGALIAFGSFLLSAAVLARRMLAAALKPFESAQRLPRAPLVVLVLSMLALLLSAAYAFAPRSSARITFLDVGQGDAALIELPSGRNLLVDAGGTHDNRFDIGRAVVTPYLRDRAIRNLDLVLLSHPHPDHMNGLFSVFRSFPVTELWSSGRDHHLPGCAALMQTSVGRGIPHRPVEAGMSRAFGPHEDLAVLHPRQGRGSGARTPGFSRENEQSLVVLLSVHGRRILFTGDIGAASVASLARAGRSLDCAVLKVPHHGSRHSAPESLVGLTRPSLAVASAGAGNRYRHPDPVVVEQYEQAGVRLLRTDRDGAVIVTIEKNGMHVRSWAELLLEEITLDSPSRWADQERRNWGRTRERISGPA